MLLLKVLCPNPQQAQFEQAGLHLQALPPREMQDDDNEYVSVITRK